MKNYWNLLDAVAIALFFVAFGLRMNPSTRLAGHTVYAIDVMVWIVRILDIFSANKHLGPYIVMIGQMVCMSIFLIKANIHVFLKNGFY